MTCCILLKRLSPIIRVDDCDGGAKKFAGAPAAALLLYCGGGGRPVMTSAVRADRAAFGDQAGEGARTGGSPTPASHPNAEWHTGTGRASAVRRAAVRRHETETNKTGEQPAKPPTLRPLPTRPAAVERKGAR